MKISHAGLCLAVFVSFQLDQVFSTHVELPSSTGEQQGSSLHDHLSKQNGVPSNLTTFKNDHHGRQIVEDKGFLRGTGGGFREMPNPGSVVTLAVKQKPPPLLLGQKVILPSKPDGKVHQDNSTGHAESSTLSHGPKVVLPPKPDSKVHQKISAGHTKSSTLSHDAKVVLPSKPDSKVHQKISTDNTKSSKLSHDPKVALPSKPDSKVHQEISTGHANSSAPKKYSVDKVKSPVASTNHTD